MTTGPPGNHKCWTNAGLACAALPTILLVILAGERIPKLSWNLRVHYLMFPDVVSRLPSTGSSRWLQLFGGVIVPDLGLGIEIVKILQCKNKPKKSIKLFTSHQHHLNLSHVFGKPHWCVDHRGWPCQDHVCQCTHSGRRKGQDHW